MLHIMILKYHFRINSAFIFHSYWHNRVHLQLTPPLSLLYVLRLQLQCPIPHANEINHESKDHHCEYTARDYQHHSHCTASILPSLNHICTLALQLNTDLSCCLLSNRQTCQQHKNLQPANFDHF